MGVLLEPASTYAVDGRDDRHLRIPFTVPPLALDRVADALTQVLESGTGQAGGDAVTRTVRPHDQ